VNKLVNRIFHRFIFIFGIAKAVLSAHFSLIYLYFWNSKSSTISTCRRAL